VIGQLRNPRFDGSGRGAEAGSRSLEQKDAILYLHTRSLRRQRRIKAFAPTSGGDRMLPAGVFDPEDVAMLSGAFQEACAFLGENGTVGPGRRDEIARVIITYARRGMRDAHRLALKAIVHAG
jgi:hypothetical protein